MLKWLPILALFVNLINTLVSGSPVNRSESVIPQFISASQTSGRSNNLPSSSYFQNENRSVIYGIRALGGSFEEGTLRIPADTQVTLILFGQQLETTDITFTKTPGVRDSNCDSLDHTPTFTANRINNGVYDLHVTLPAHSGSFYICTLDKDRRSWNHQGDASYLQIGTKVPILPVWVSILLIFTLLSFSGLFSGLNLGLMSLDKNELQVIARCGTEVEKQYARAIAPIRRRGNYLLCSILLGNVFVNSTLTILMDDLTSGLVAVISSTLAIVIFGEIVPQAACSRHGLAVGAKTIGVTYFFMALTFPLSYPISKILDFCLGDEIGHVYDRERLMEYIKVTKTYNKLEEDEVNIISGALCLKTKTVCEIMTRLEDVFMLPITATLDFNTVSEISKKGYSRIPVYDSERKNVCALLHAKDLAFIDPDDNTPLRTIIEFYKHQLIHTYEDETLNNLLNHFRLGKSHMAFVRKIFATEDADPYHEITGVVTLEDVIEEILQMEIVDETDILIDNRKKQRRKGAEHQDFTDFARIGAGPGTQHISSQMALATFQYLSTAVEPFKKAYLSETVLRRLIAQKIYYYVKNVGDYDARSLQERTIYTAGRPANYFVMILEGKAKVNVGSEALMFDAGPFTYFGTTALRLAGSDMRNSTAAIGGTRPPTPESPGFGSMDIKKAIEANKLPQQPGADPGITFIPDFTLVITEPTLYMKVPRNVYCAAYRASLLEYQKGFPPDEDKLQREIDSAFKDSINDQSPDLSRKDYSSEKEKLLSDGQLKSDGTSPYSERRPSSPKANQPPPTKRKNSLAALARLPAQAAAVIFSNNSSSKAPNSPLSNFPPTLSLSSSKITPTPDRKPTPPSSQQSAQQQVQKPIQPELPPSPTKYNPSNRRNGSPSKGSGSPVRGRSPSPKRNKSPSPKRGRTPSPPGSPKEDSALISKTTSKPN